MRAVAMRSGAVHDEHGGGRPLVHIPGNDLPMGNVNGTGNVTCGVQLGASCIDQDEIGLTGRHRMMHIPAVGFKTEAGREMSIRGSWLSRWNFSNSGGLDGRIHGGSKNYSVNVPCLEPAE